MYRSLFAFGILLASATVHADGEETVCPALVREVPMDIRECVFEVRVWGNAELRCKRK